MPVRATRKTRPEKTGRWCMTIPHLGVVEASNNQSIKIVRRFSSSFARSDAEHVPGERFEAPHQSGGVSRADRRNICEPKMRERPPAGSGQHVLELMKILVEIDPARLNLRIN